MKIIKDTNINTWYLDLGKYQIPFWKWGFGIDKRQNLPEVKRIGYKNIFRFNAGRK